MQLTLKVINLNDIKSKIYTYRILHVEFAFTLKLPKVLDYHIVE